LGVTFIDGLPSQNGSLIGCTSVVRCAPAAKTTVAVSLNSYDPRARDALADNLMRRLTGWEPSAPRRPLIDFDIAELAGEHQALMMGMGRARVTPDGLCVVDLPHTTATYRLARSEAGELLVRAERGSPSIGAFRSPSTGVPTLRVSVSAFHKL
jgi:hypothetical protein